MSRFLSLLLLQLFFVFTDQGHTFEQDLLKQDHLKSAPQARLNSLTDSSSIEDLSGNKDGLQNQLNSYEIGHKEHLQGHLTFLSYPHSSHFNIHTQGSRSPPKTS